MRCSSTLQKLTFLLTRCATHLVRCNAHLALLVIPNDLVDKVFIQHGDEFCQQPRSALNVFDRNHFDGRVHVADWNTHNQRRDAFGSDLQIIAIRAGAAGKDFHAEGDFELSCQFLELVK